jgi:hypothetical protein
MKAGVMRAGSVMRRLLQPETYALIMEPALADLEFESGSVTAYFGVLRAFAGAVAYDACRDLRLSVGNAEWRASRREDFSTFAGLVVVQAVYYLALLGIATGSTKPGAILSGSLLDDLFALVVLAAATLLLPVITVAICFWGGGRPARP